MAITRQYSSVLGGYGGDDGGVWTRTINFAPGHVSAQVALFEVDGEGAHQTAIKGYRVRPDPNGAEQVVDYGWRGVSFVSAVEQMSSVTWGVWVGAHQEAHARLDLFWWS